MTIDDTETVDLEERVRKAVDLYGHLVVSLDSLDADDDLFRAGMTSHANVHVMLALEEMFDIEFPEDMLNRTTFESLGAISRAIASLLQEQ